MKLTTQLYIDTSIDGAATENYQIVEFFDFESIEITETIKNIQEVDVIFTDYTKNFVVPASKNNNKIFQHYYSTKLVNSFDARIKKKARLFLNGILFKQGYIRLSSAKIKDGYPYSYDLNFFGALSGLGDVIGEDKLADLEYLEKYNHDFSLDNVFSGLTKGLQYNGTDMEEFSNKVKDIVYPLISVRNKWFYDGGGTSADLEFKEGFSVNMYNDDGLGSPDSNFGINYNQLKPAIKVSHIFDAISEKYESINIKKDSFIYGTKLKDLYLLLHSNKDVLTQGIGDNVSIESIPVSTGYFSLTSGDKQLLPILTLVYRQEGLVKRVETEVTITIEITDPTSGDVDYTMNLYDGSDILATKRTQTRDDSLSFTLSSENEKVWNNLRFELESRGGINTYKLSMVIVETDTQTRSGSNVSVGTVTSNYTTFQTDFNFPQKVELFRQVPDMKVVDFMDGIFKTFNLVAKVDDSTGEIDVIPLKDFYVSGVDRDITGYVDSANYDIDRLQTFGSFNFKFSEAQTFGLLNHNEVTQDTFGDLLYPDDKEGGNENLVFDKGSYDVEVPFEKLYFSRLTDENNGNLTTICDGWLVGEDQDPIITKPILFFNINTPVDTGGFQFGMRGKSQFISTYNRGSNSNQDQSLSLNFNSEIDEYTFDIVENSLFELYYKDYIKNTFNRESRNLKIEANLPLSFLLQYNLSDRLLIDGSPFIINEITTNLNTGKSQLDLITAFDITVEEFVDVIAPNSVTGLAVEKTFATSIQLIWNSNAEADLAGYKIYAKKTADAGTPPLIKTLGLINYGKITGLDPSTSYDISVSAFDEAGNESGLGTTLTTSTGALDDNQAPTVPSNVRTTVIGSIAASIEWDASIDDVEVSLYRIYVDNVADGTTTDTDYTITGLTANNTYDVQVTAEDTNGNESKRSAAITVTTVNT